MNARLEHRSGRLLAALALIALVLFGRIAESFHAAQDEHAVCPEHGELVHVAGAHAEADASHDDVPIGTRIQPIQTSAAHEHCLLAALLWSSGATWTPAETQALVHASVCECVVPAVECARFSLPPLSFAPKHSPPARVV